MENVKQLVLNESKKGNVVIATPDGITGVKLDDLINQPVEGILYDLNRNESVILTFIDDVKWINDYACAQVIRALKAKVDALENVGK